MAKRIFLAFLSAILLTSLAMAQVVMQKPKYVYPRVVYVWGKGIITYKEDPLNFEPVRVFFGKMSIYIPGIDDWEETEVGVIIIGNRSYRMVPTTYGNDTFDANIVDRSTGQTIGGIHLEYITKYWQGLWVGELDLSNKSFYVYIHQYKGFPILRALLDRLPPKIRRKLVNRMKNEVDRLVEMRNCLENPGSRKCMEIIRNCLRTRDYACRLFINEYCKRTNMTECRQEIVRMRNKMSNIRNKMRWRR